jgi:hypothetical protein
VAAKRSRVQCALLCAEGKSSRMPRLLFRFTKHMATVPSTHRSMHSILLWWSISTT